MKDLIVLSAAVAEAEGTLHGLILGLGFAAHHPPPPELIKRMESARDCAGALRDELVSIERLIGGAYGLDR